MKHPLAQNAGLIVTSPMVRTVQTALGSLDWLIEKGVKIEADAGWQGTFFVDLYSGATGERGEAAEALKGPTARALRSTPDFMRLCWLSSFLFTYPVAFVSFTSMQYFSPSSHPPPITSPRTRMTG